MYLGDIKAEALTLMGINTLNASYPDIDALKTNPTYQGFLFSMVGAINRALDRFLIVGAIDHAPVIDHQTLESEDIAIDSALARIIPYYIVGEIYALDEPNIAANCRNIFEQSLEEYVGANRQGSVIVEYRVGG